MRVLLLICILMMTASSCYGDGTISVNLIRYENREGKSHNGHCCDGKWGICQQNGCDHAFIVCIDQLASNKSVRSCAYGQKSTEAIRNTNTIVFGNKIHDTPNPMRFSINGAIPSSVTLKVRVADYDSYSENEFVDFLRKDFNVTNKLNSNMILQRRTWLEVQVWVNCSTEYYGSQCQTNCPSPKQSDHYTCDVITGNRICQQGWTGKECDDAPCDNIHCQHNGTCHVTAHGRPLCVCTADYTGDLCEIHKCELICKPGVCLLLTHQALKFICRCEVENGSYIFGSEAPCEFPTTTKVYSTTQTTKLPPQWNNDCSTITQDPVHGPESRGRSGFYKIHPPGGDSFDVFCDMTSSAEGWTVIQRRLNGSEDFFRGWDNYRDGFGTFKEGGEYWLGLEKIYRMTSSKRYKLRIDITDYYGDLKYADYEEFYIDDEKNDYRLHIGKYSGDAGDALKKIDEDDTRYHNGMAFSTYDHDKDTTESHNCAELFQSGWWFSSCFRSNLNGVYRDSTGDARCCAYKDICVTWQTIDRLSLKHVEMKIIPLYNN